MTKDRELNLAYKQLAKTKADIKSVLGLYKSTSSDSEKAQITESLKALNLAKKSISDEIERLVEMTNVNQEFEPIEE